jgi:polysaccharide biosynthesis/export protein
MRSWINDWLDPSEVGRFGGRPVTREIRATLGLQDEEVEEVDASEPLPDDTVTLATEYQIGPGDLLEVTIHELIRAGSILTETRRVSDLGYISLPRLGRVNVAGMTEYQAEEMLKAKLVPDFLSDPIVTVVVREERQRYFMIVGFAARAGPIPIPRPDFRMLEALSHAGSLPQEVEKVYVIRKPSAVDRTKEEAPPTAPSSPKPDTPAGLPDAKRSGASGGLWEDSDILLNEMVPGGGGSRPERVVPPTQPAVTKPAAISDQERRELLEAIVPGAPATKTAPSSKTSTVATPTRKPTTQAAEKELSKWMWLNGDWVEVRDEPTTQSQPLGESAPITRSAPASEPTTTVEWQALAEAEDQMRIISIPVKQLHAGEARYNIVIRTGDVISIPIPDAGQRYYVLGHVRGPGAYIIPPEGITLKGAVAAAGGLDPFAWPDRCEIARKIGPDQEELHQVNLDRIFAFQDDDVDIKPGDVVNVGTHPLSPFLVSISSGFRTTYGFGFVYDRNFGTIDSYGAQQNPKDRRRAEQNSRFPALQAVFPNL